MNTRLLSCLLLGLFNSALGAYEGPLAKALWVDFDGERHTIMVADYDGEDWSVPAIMHTSKNPMTSIAIGANASGTELLVWTEQIKQQSQLMHKWLARDTQQWSEAELLSNFGQENIGASVVVDGAGQLQLFWSGNAASDFGDIMQMTYSNGRWSKPAVIHKPNNVPDIQPNANLDLNGNVVVSWSSYSSEAGQYIETEKVFEVGNQSFDQSTQNAAPTMTDAIGLADVTLPDFLPSDSTTTLYFPHNAILQSTSVTP